MTARRLLAAVAVLALLLIGAQLWLQHYARGRLEALLAEARTWAQIDVGRANFWLWGVADLYDIRITPNAWVAANYGLPLGDSARIQRLRIHHLRPTFTDGLGLAAADVDFDGVDLPLPDWGWAVTVARGADGRRLRAPTATDLGLRALRLDLRARLRFDRGWYQPQVSASTAIPRLARVQAECRLELAAATVNAPDAIAVRDCRLRYQDEGLARHFESWMAAHNGISIADLKTAIARQVALDAERARWPPLNTQAVQGFIHTPRSLQLAITPPHPLPLGRIPRAVWPGLPAYLGLTATLPRTP